ncbi:MAG: DUF881 domain-containing protein [Clostridia bacterium]|nr:DUF881 domain-containing protein [Clostridia bacterium]
MDKKAQAGIVLICTILGFFVSVQVKNVGQNDSGSYVSAIRYEQLQDMLMTEKEKTEALYKQVMEYKDEILKYQENASEESGTIELLKNELDKAEVLSGLSEVTGPGVTVTLTDGDSNSSVNVDSNMYIIHDEDVLRVLNELRAAGAEAISLNGERIVATSEIRCAGPTISVNNTRTAAPFVINAIGNPSELESALKMRGGVADILSRWVKIDIVQQEELTLPAYKGLMDFKYADKRSGDSNETDKK